MSVESYYHHKLQWRQGPPGRFVYHTKVLFQKPLGYSSLQDSLLLKQQDKMLSTLLGLPCVLNTLFLAPLIDYPCKTLWRLLLPFCSRVNYPCRLSILIALAQEDHSNFPSEQPLSCSYMQHLHPKNLLTQKVAEVQQHIIHDCEVVTFDNFFT